MVPRVQRRGRAGRRGSKDALGCVAAVVVALASLAGCLYHVSVLLDLTRDGIRAPAQVVGFERGARNTKWAVYRFAVEGGETVTARDVFQQYVRRVEKGEAIVVLYDPEEPSRVTADLGAWNWQAPVIFGGGFVLLIGLAIAIGLHARKTRYAPRAEA